MCVSVQNGSVNVDSVVTVAARLAEAGHYGAERIAMVSSRLQEDWKSLTTALEERSNTLAMATGFHQGAEQVISDQFTCTCLTNHLPVSLTIYLSPPLSWLCICLPVSPPTFAPVHLPDYLPIYMTVNLLMAICLHVYTCPSTILPVFI